MPRESDARREPETRREIPVIEETNRAPVPVRVALDLREAGEMPALCYVEGLLNGFAAIEAPVMLTLIGEEREVPEGLTVERWIPATAGHGTLATRKKGSRGIDAGDVELVHGFGAAVPAIRAPRYLLTIHDLEASMGPGWTTRFIHRWGLRRATGRNLRLIATSAKARDALDMLSPRLRESIWMIHSGPGNVRAFPASARASASVAHKRWFLTTSEGGRAENMNFLIAAMALWYRKRPDAPRLIWAGDASSEMQDRWTRIPARARHHIRVMPVESEEMRDQLFGEAIALIIPDLEPAHAYDALEAMSRGVPVMCARRRPFTDLLGQAPLWFDPRDSSTLWRALDALLDDATLRPEVVRRGLREAARYDWRDTAEMTLGAYRQLMRTFPGS